MSKKNHANGGNISLPDVKTIVPIKLSEMEKDRRKKFGTVNYIPKYAKLAYDLLRDSQDALSKCHVCSLLRCSRTTLNRWMVRFPDFGKAITDGMEIGKMKWKQRMADHAYFPTSEVNNGLIKFISGNVYGMKEEPTPAFNININNGDPIEAMKKRGLPVPDVGVEDIGDDSEGGIDIVEDIDGEENENNNDIGNDNFDDTDYSLDDNELDDLNE